MENLAYSVKEAAAAIGVSVGQMYNIVHIADFPKKVVGGKILIPVKLLERWLENGEPAEIT